MDAAVEAFLRDHPGRTRGSVRIVCFGLTFKPDIDDIRESPAVEIVRALMTRYPDQVAAVEPNLEGESLCVKGTTIPLLPYSGATASADVILLLVDHKEFRTNVPTLQRGQRVVDTRGIWI